MKKSKLGILFTLFSAATLSACGLPDDNDKPVYGKDSGLPVNCRAYIQTSIDGYRRGEYTAEEAMSGLERNCGLNGQVWKNNR